MLYIDSDASMNSRGSSFWRKIGMLPVGEYDEYNGYELSISLKDLLTKISNKKCTAPKRKNSKSKRGGRRKDSKDSKDIKHNKDIKYIKEIN
jgi:hypothetical protein